MTENELKRLEIIYLAWPRGIVGDLLTEIRMLQKAIIIRDEWITKQLGGRPLFCVENKDKR